MNSIIFLKTFKMQQQLWLIFFLKGKAVGLTTVQ